MTDMTDEEYAELDERWTQTTPKVNFERPGIFARQRALLDNDDSIAIETDLTDEERALIEEGVKHYHEHPEDFVPLEQIK